MITLQIINKILSSGDSKLIINNNLDDTHFPFYEKEFNYINEHLNKYGNIPNKETFLSKFTDFELFDVTESDEFLIDSLFEEHLYNIACPVAVKFAELLKSDANEATLYLLEQAPNLILTKGNNGIDIIKNAKIRYQEYLDKSVNPDECFIPTGFWELDALVGGWSRGEELVVIFARTGKGKSWVTLKTLKSAWENKMRTGLISPEMTSSKVGFRFDTINSGISNTSLLRGYESNSYQKYINDLSKNDTPFIIATPKDFKRKITVSKLKHFCQVNKLDILGIDGVGYLTDERTERGDKRYTALTNISEDLMSLSCELNIPIIIVTQSNREIGDDGPEIENIKDSDGIAANASKIIAVKQDNGVLGLGIKKNRYGEENVELRYSWNIDKGEFIYIPKQKCVIKNKKKIDSDDNTGVF